MTFTLAYYERSASITTAEYSIPGNTTSGVPTSQTTAGYWQPMIDLHNLAAGDEFQFKVYEKVEAAGTQRATVTYTFAGVQSDPHPLLIAFPLGNGWDMTLKKVAGTDRTIAARVSLIS